MIKSWFYLTCGAHYVFLFSAWCLPNVDILDVLLTLISKPDVSEQTNILASGLWSSGILYNPLSADLSLCDWYGCIYVINKQQKSLQNKRARISTWWRAALVMVIFICPQGWIHCGFLKTTQWLGSSVQAQIQHLLKSVNDSCVWVKFVEQVKMRAHKTIF